MAASARTHSKHFLRGCFGGAVAVSSDAGGCACWVAHLSGKPARSVSNVVAFSTAIRTHNEKVDVPVTAGLHLRVCQFSTTPTTVWSARFRGGHDGIGRSAEAVADALSEQWWLALRTRRFGWDNGSARQNCCLRSYVLEGLPPSIGCVLSCC